MTKVSENTGEICSLSDFFELLETVLLDSNLTSVKYYINLFQMMKIFTFYENIDIFTFKLIFWLSVWLHKRFESLWW